MTKDEALNLALEALQWSWGGEPLPTLELQAINAIKEALAQPEQESDDLTADDLTAAYLSGLYDGKNKYAPQSFTYEQVKAHIQAALMSSSMPQLQTFTGENPFSPQRKPLTDEQLIAAYESEQQGRYGDHIRSLRAIEAAHGIKGE